MTEITDSKHDLVADDEESYMPSDRRTPLMYDADYITERLEGSITRFSQISSENQKKYKQYKRTEIVIAGTIPFAIMLSAVEFVEAVAVLRIALLLYSAVGGALLAFMSNVMKISEYYDRWKNFRAKSEVLKREHFLYITQMPPYHDVDAFPQLVDRVEEILDELDKEEEKDKK